MPLPVPPPTQQVDAAQSVFQVGPDGQGVKAAEGFSALAGSISQGVDLSTGTLQLLVDIRTELRVLNASMALYLQQCGIGVPSELLGALAGSA